MSSISHSISSGYRCLNTRSLRDGLAAVVPEARLEWQPVPGTGLSGFLLERDTATKPLSAESTDRVMNSPPFWSLLWPAGGLLCRLFSTHPHLMAGRACVDLGCGSGLVATALALGGAGVIAADQDELSRRATALHAFRHGVELEVEAVWEGARAQSVILADFLYDEDNLSALSLLEERCEEVLVVDSRLGRLKRPDFHFLGSRECLAVPDLDPHGEFGLVRVWYKGSRADLFKKYLPG